MKEIAIMVIFVVDCCKKTTSVETRKKDWKPEGSLTEALDDTKQVFFNWQVIDE